MNATQAPEKASAACVSCRAEVPTSAYYCPKCGSTVRAARINALMDGPESVMIDVDVPSFGEAIVVGFSLGVSSDHVQLMGLPETGFLEREWSRERILDLQTERIDDGRVMLNLAFLAPTGQSHRSGYVLTTMVSRKVLDDQEYGRLRRVIDAFMSKEGRE